MASKLTIAWCVGVPSLCAGLAWLMLPAGAVVDRAVRVAERVFDERSELPEEAHARKLLNDARDVLSVYAYWQESDSVRRAVEEARAEGRGFVATIFGSSDDSRRASNDARIANTLQTCEVGTLRLDETVSAVLEADACPGIRGPTDLWALDVTVRGSLGIDLASASFDPYLLLVDESGRAIVSDFDSGPGLDAHIGRPLLAGRYYVLGSAERTGLVGPYDLTVSFIPNDEARLVVAGESVDAQSEGPFYELGLDSDAGHLVRSPDGSTISIEDSTNELQGAWVLFPTVDRSVQMLMTKPFPTGWPSVSVSQPLPSRGRPMAFDESLVDTLRRGETMTVLEFEVPDQRLVAIDFRVASVGVNPGDFQVFLLASGATIARAWTFEEELTTGRYRLLVTRTENALADDLPFEVTLSCKAQIVPVRLDAETVWSGADECSTERTDKTIWAFDVAEPSVVSVDWDGEGSAGLYTGRRSRGRLEMLEAGSHRVVATGTASERVRIADDGPAGPYISARMQEALADLQGSDSRTVVGVAFAPPGARVTDRWATFGLARSATYAEPSTEGGSCVVVHRGEVSNLIGDWGPSTLGACRLFAKYDWPGEFVQRWLEDGGIDFATAPTRDVDSRRLPDFGVRDDRAMLGAIKRFDFAPHIEACLEGAMSRCEDFWAGAERRGLAGAVPAIYLERRGFGRSAYGHEASLLADLEGEFGEEAFARFWRSQLEVGEAFEASFGLPRAEWTYAWAAARLGPRTSREGLWLDGIFSLLLVLVLGAIAAWVGYRRSVG